MAGVGDKLMTASEIKAVTDTKLAKDFSSLPSIDHSLENNYLFAVQRSDKSQASKIAYSALGTDILNKIGSNGVVSVDHGGTGASNSSGARTNLDVYSKSETSSAIAQSMATTDVKSLFTVAGNWCNVTYAYRTGNVVYIQLWVASGTTNGKTLVTISNTILPVIADYCVPCLYEQAGTVANSTAWIEHTDVSKVTYYGDTSTAVVRVNLMYFTE